MSRRTIPLGSTALAVLLVIAVVLGRRHRGPVVHFLDAGLVNGATDVGTAPMFAVSASGEQALAWVSAPDSGTDGRLYVSVGDTPPVELRDPLGPVEAHGESPPKLAYGADGALNAIYVLPRVVPGRRFPLAALRFIRSTDGGKTWSRPVSVTDDAVFGTHNFHALHAGADGSLYVAWLDDRGGRSRVYLTRSTDGGKTWEANRPVASGEACPCCRTALATASDGTLYLAWRFVFPGNVRDIVVARSHDHGATWSAPSRVHADDWVYPGCPHAGPSIQVDASGRLHVAWWTGKEGAAGVSYARSDDGGRTFSRPIALGIARYSRPAHVQLALGRNQDVVTAWDDGTKEVSQVVLRVSHDGGASFGPMQAVSMATRAAAFPVLAVRDSIVTVAWSEESVETAQRQAATAARMPKDMPMGPHPIGEAQVVVRWGYMP